MLLPVLIHLPLAFASAIGRNARVVSTDASLKPLAEQCVTLHETVEGDDCAGVAKKYGISLKDLLSWNPLIAPLCDTKLMVGSVICVGVSNDVDRRDKPSTADQSHALSPPGYPSPVQPRITTDCRGFYKARPGDTCNRIAGVDGSFSVEDFIAWNPDVEPDCSQLLAWYYYCIAVSDTDSPSTTTTAPPPSAPTPAPTPGPTSSPIPQPQQPGISPKCKAFYLVKAGDTCTAIERTHNISDSEFRAWNNRLNASCTNLWAGYHVCVGI
ncbi:hypothetical protein FQN57_001380 [Myotisia sp. PD_48]|nr:hypothetical protein FQN57_001380 [Myotisia sp. PD_48]